MRPLHVLHTNFNARSLQPVVRAGKQLATDGKRGKTRLLTLSGSQWERLYASTQLDQPIAIKAKHLKSLIGFPCRCFCNMFNTSRWFVENVFYQWHISNHPKRLVWHMIKNNQMRIDRGIFQWYWLYKILLYFNTIDKWRIVYWHNYRKFHKIWYIYLTPINHGFEKWIKYFYLLSISIDIPIK